MSNYSDDLIQSIAGGSLNGPFSLAPLLHALLEAKAAPPPQIIVQYKDREVVVSRDILIRASMPILYASFTNMLDLASISKEPLVTVDDKVAKKSVKYLPMRLYATFLRGASADGIYREIPEWESSWRGIVPNIDRIRVLTMPEHRAELLKRAGEANSLKEQAILKRDSQSTLADGS